jgi:hypothetical protein
LFDLRSQASFASDPPRSDRGDAAAAERLLAPHFRAISTALALALDGDDVEAAPRRPETPRLPEGRKIVKRARHLGAYLQATQNRRGTRPLGA